LRNVADALLPEYRAIVASIPPEAGFAESGRAKMFLFYAAVKPFTPKQVLESGRARAKARSFWRAVLPTRESSASNTIDNRKTPPPPEAKLKSERNVEREL